MTIISWLNLYLQVDALKDVPKVLLPQYSQEKFIQIAQVGNKPYRKVLVWSVYGECCTPKAEEFPVSLLFSPHLLLC